MTDQQTASATDADARPCILIGTAGHIDHGKSRLVQALTGHDPDRLPEEKARGMTIELGFAHAALPEADLWFVDVPGHERFIRTMVAGAAGIDLALLVVAADDSVMPQTREHAEVLKLLGVRHCLVVLTKLDLVDAEWAAAVAEEVGDLLADLQLEMLDCIHTSAVTGQGLDQLTTRLVAAARQRDDGETRPAWFRLPIDRSFSIPGRGTVVTGSLLHGSLRPGDDLELLPACQRVRGRELQTDGTVRGAIGGRTRLAVNLAAVRVDDARRGMELAAPGYLEPTQCLAVRLDRLRAPGKRLRKRQRLRLHLATTEVRCEIQLAEPVDGDSAADVLAQIRTDEPVVATWGQRLILRDDAGTRTLGGGGVVLSRARPWSSRRPPDHDTLETLRRGKPRDRLLAALRLADWTPPAPAALAARTGCRDAATVEKLLRELGTSGRVVRLAGGAVPLARDLLEDAATHPVARLAAEARRNPRWTGVASAAWPAWMPSACPATLRPALAEWLIAEQRVALVNGYVLPAGHASAMSDEDQRLLAGILAELEAGAYTPTPVADLKALAGKPRPRGEELIELALARGELVRISDGIYLTAGRWNALAGIIRGLLAEGAGFTVSELRQALDSTRKYVVPLAEALDKAGLTRRHGDVRVAGPKLPPHG